MVSFFQQLLDVSSFPPRWRCGMWSDAHGWLHIVSDLAIFGAYFTIPVALAYFVLRRKDMPFTGIFWLFALFILSCGIGHAIEATLFWHPWYRLSGTVKLITAIASWATVFAIIPMVPKALALPGLSKINAQLEREIIERKHAEEERLKLEQQIQQSQRMESLGILAGGIAHDFNNLLTSILGHADLAIREVSPESQISNHISEVLNGAHRAAELTNQMLAFSGKGRFVVEPLNVTEVVEAMSRLLLASISKKCTLLIRSEPNLPAIECDASQLRQIIINLVINGSEAIGDQNGTIVISTGVRRYDRGELADAYLDKNLPEGNYVTLTVSDSGCGMTPDTIEKIFDPFYTTKFTGRGLGLAAVLGIVRGHHGAIIVKSEMGKGSSFSILFPVSALPAKTMRQDITSGGEWRANGTVLIIDDEESVRELAGWMMRKIGLKTIAAANGREGLDQFQREGDRISLVLLDMTMPEMNGEETVRELRRIRPDVKVVLTSGYNEQTATSQFSDAKFDGFIQKPYSYESMVSIIRRTLNA